jgi:hypothetical protein
MLRFKTEEEFINEYGEQWRNSVDWKIPEMNYLFGIKVPDKFAQSLINNNTIRLRSQTWEERESWTIYPYMVKDDEIR